MNYKLKNIFFQIFDRVLFGENIYHFTQEYITHSLDMTDKEFITYYKAKVLPHKKALKKYGDANAINPNYFEFGAGWDLLAPFGFTLNGEVKRYIAVDLNEHICYREIVKMINLYKRNRRELEKLSGEKFIKIQDSFDMDIQSAKNCKKFLADKFNIVYKAPFDAGNTSLNEKVIDYVVSNVTLEHIPKSDIIRILDECFRIMKIGGIMSLTIDYTDHWSHSDKKINAYNFLKFSNQQWKMYNPSLHFQNRLRHSDYRKLINNAGFEIIQEIYSQPSEEDINNLIKIKVADEFSRYSKDDLLIQKAQFVAIKP